MSEFKQLEPEPELAPREREDSNHSDPERPSQEHRADVTAAQNGNLVVPNSSASTGFGAVAGSPHSRTSKKPRAGSRDEAPPLPDATAGGSAESSLEVDPHSVSAASVNIEAPPFPLELRFEDLSYFVTTGFGKDQAEKQVLYSVNGVVKPGELLAVMGPTGAGKSSLLNLLAGQTKVGVIKGAVKYNGKPRTKFMKRWSAYVLQDDTFFSQLTVRETLQFSAAVRLPSSIPRVEKEKQVDRVIRMLNMDKCVNTIVGGPFQRGVSGGERRRLNIGNEILMNPSLLLCDEPTSGLDSSTAHTVLQTLVQLARSGRSIVVTIHQPSSRMFAQFDKLLLMAQGKTIYFGPAAKVIPYLAMQGYPAPNHYNPADFILELVTEEELAGGAPKIDTLAKAYIEFAEKANAYEYPSVDAPLEDPYALQALPLEAPGSLHSRAGKTKAINARQPSNGHELEMDELSRRPSKASDEVVVQVDPVEVANKLDSKPDTSPGTEAINLSLHDDAEQRWATTFYEQFIALTIRSYKQQRGDRITGLYLGQYVSLSLIAGMVWFAMGNSEDGLTDKTGYLFFAVVFWSMNGLFTSLTNFPAERAVLMKERASGCYRVSAYFLAKTTSEIPVEIMYPTLYVFISYWMVGLTADGGKFISHWLTILLCMLCAQSIGLSISAGVMDFKRSIVVASVLMLGLMLLSGFYVNSSNIPVWIKWVAYLSNMKYGYAAVMQIEFNNLNVHCATSASNYVECINNPSGTIPGNSVLDKYSVNSISVGANVGIMFGFFFFFRFLAYILLRRNK